MVIRREGSDNQMLLYAILDESFARDVGQHCTLSISAGDGISLAAEAVGFTLEPVLQTLLSYRLITSSPQLIPMSSARLVSSWTSNVVVNLHQHSHAGSDMRWQNQWHTSGGQLFAISW